MSISSPPNFGTPDWQRGVIQGQTLLATVASPNQSVQVNIPASCKTLVIAGRGLTGVNNVTVAGVTTDIYYPCVRAPGTEAVGGTTTWLASVSRALDTSVTVTLSANPLYTWYVYADGHPFITVDGNKLTNDIGQQYVIPSAPSNAAGDHPPVELQASTFAISAGGTILAAPPAGQRHRVFGVEMASWIGSAGGAIFSTVYAASGTNLCHLGVGGGSYAGGQSRMDFLPSGFPLGNAEAILLNYDSGSGSLIRGVIVHTTETI